MTLASIDDDLWSALGDPTRRRMLDILLTEGSGASTSLSDRLPVSRQAVAKHLTVLGRAGLVRDSVVGRERHYEIDRSQFGRAVDQLNAVVTEWDGRLSRIKRLAETIRQTKNQTPEPSEED